MSKKNKKNETGACSSESCRNTKRRAEARRRLGEVYKKYIAAMVKSDERGDTKIPRIVEKLKKEFEAAYDAAK